MGMDTSYVPVSLEEHLRQLNVISFTDSRELVCSPTSRLHGYEFSNQGLLGLWEGFAPLPQVPETQSFGVLDGILTIPTTSSVDASLSPLSTSAVLDPLTRMRQLPDDFAYGDFTSAVAALCARRTGSERPWRAHVRTNKLEQRQFALYLCEWGIGEEELNHTIRKQVRCVCGCFLIAELLMQMGEGWSAVKGSLLACLYAPI